MKFLFDFLPLLVFFGAYAAFGIYAATGAAMVATTAQVVWSWARHRKVDRLLWVNFFAVMVFGSLTLVFQDKQFIMMKPTIVYWIMGGGLFVSQTFFRKNAIRLMMESQFDAPERLWNRWNAAWAVFFVALGFVNLFVARNFSEAVWVDFKVFGALLLTFVLVIAQVWTLMPYAKQKEAEEHSVK